MEALLREAHAKGARWYSLAIRHQLRMRAMSICEPDLFDQALLAESDLARAQVIHLVLKHVPAPSESHSLDDVLAPADLLALEPEELAGVLLEYVNETNPDPSAAVRCANTTTAAWSPR